jgi:molybdate transport system substrate-binding protein
VGVKDGHDLPDISTVSSLRQTLLNAKSIGYSEGASGSYVSNVLLHKLGIEDEVAGKSKVILGRKFVGDAIADGDVELGIQQVSELRLEPQVAVVGPLLDEQRKISVVLAAISSKSAYKDIAESFLIFLASPISIDALRKSGLEIPTK